MAALTWSKTTDRFGGRVEYAVTEIGLYVVDGNGYGRMRWTADYANGDGCMTDTRGEARANCESHYAERRARAARRCSCGADQHRGCFCGLSLSEFLAAHPERRP